MPLPFGAVFRRFLDSQTEVSKEVWFYWALFCGSPGIICTWGKKNYYYYYYYYYYLPIRPQMKMNILKKFIYSNLTDSLKKYAFGATWIRQNLDSVCCSCVREWLGLPPSACLREVLSMTRSMCGFGIPSIEEISEKLKVKRRFRL